MENKGVSMDTELKHELKEIRKFLFGICAELCIIIIYIMTH